MRNWPIEEPLADSSAQDPLGHKFIEKVIPVNITDWNLAFANINGIIVNRFYLFDIDDIRFAYPHKHMLWQLVMDSLYIHGSDQFLALSVHHDIILQTFDE